MNDNEFEKQIREKLAQHEVAPPPQLWEEIAPLIPVHQGWSIPLWARYGIAVAAIFLGVVVVNSLHQLGEEQSALPATILEVAQQQNPTTSVDASTQKEEKPLVASLEEAMPQTVAATQTVVVASTTQPPHVVAAEETHVAKVQSAEVETEEPTTPLPRRREVGQEEQLPSKSSRVALPRREASKPFALNLLASNSLAVTNRADGASLLRNTPHLSEIEMPRESDGDIRYNHHMPLTVGLTLERKLNERWGIQSGVVYSLLYSDFSSEQKKGEQSLHYLGIPLKLSYQLGGANRFSFYLSAGGEIDFNLCGRRSFTNQESYVEDVIYTELHDDAPQLSLNLTAGVTYPLANHLSLYAESGVAYYLENGSDDISNAWKEKPLSLVLQLGVRTHF